MQKEIKKYTLRFEPQQTTYQQPYFAYIYLWDDTTIIGSLTFWNPDLFRNIQPPYIDQYGCVVMSFRAPEMPMIVDLLRNEKPVYLFGSETPPTWFILTTSQEPAGEGERAGP